MEKLSHRIAIMIDEELNKIRSLYKVKIDKNINLETLEEIADDVACHNIMIKNICEHVDLLTQRLDSIEYLYSKKQDIKECYSLIEQGKIND